MSFTFHYALPISLPDPCLGFTIYFYLLILILNSPFINNAFVLNMIVDCV